MERCPTASVSVGLNCSWKLIACRANRLFLGLRITLHLLGTYCSLLVDQSAASELPWGQTLLSLSPAWVSSWKRREAAQNLNWIFFFKASVFPRYKSTSLSSSDAAANKFFLILSQAVDFILVLPMLLFLTDRASEELLVAEEHKPFPVISCLLWFYSDSSRASQINCAWTFPTESTVVEATAVQIIMFWIWYLNWQKVILSWP